MTTMFGLSAAHMSKQYLSLLRTVKNNSRPLVANVSVAWYSQKRSFPPVADVPEEDSSIPQPVKRRLSAVEKQRLQGLSGWKLRLEEEKMRSFGPWRPEKRVARSTMEQMRMLHKEFPDKYDVKALSAQYNISFEAVRRILHSSFEPTPEIAERQEKRRQEQRDTYVTDLMNKRREGEREKRYQTSSDSQSTDRYSRDNDRYSRGNDKYSRDNDKYSRDNDRYLRDNDKYSRDNDRYSRDNDRYSRDNDRYSRDNNGNNRYDSRSTPRRQGKLSELDMIMEKESIKIHPAFTNRFLEIPLYKSVQRDLLNAGEQKWQQKVRTSRAKRFAETLGITKDHINDVRLLYKTNQEQLKQSNTKKI